MQITLQFALALEALSGDPEVQEALDDFDAPERLAELFGTASDEQVAYRAMRDFLLRELEKRQAMRKNLALHRFSQEERNLLELHPQGREFLQRMAEGDEGAVEPAADLLAVIRKERASLGLI